MANTNRVVLSGRLTRDPEVRYTQDNSMAIARYTLAVNRRAQKGAEQTADFISCVAFGKTADAAQKYLAKGKKVIVTGRLQTGSYTNKDGYKVYTTDVVVEEQEFIEYSNGTEGSADGAEKPEGKTVYGRPSVSETEGGFIDIPDEDSFDYPFK